MVSYSNESSRRKRYAVDTQQKSCELSEKQFARALRHSGKTVNTERQNAASEVVQLHWWYIYLGVSRSCQSRYALTLEDAASAISIVRLSWNKNAIETLQKQQKT